LSTAAGIATLSDQKVICILGDMGFMYDSNALWNKRLPQNLKIIIINNGGGNIFGMINGPDTQESYNEYFLAHHPVHIQKLSEAYGVGHYKASNMVEVEQTYPDFYKAPSASILEVVIPTEANTGIINKLVNKLNSRYEQK
jgi:2-succinyl-5-enolpyruvyl-6-hydroxy-3-cyclohexene-1-carboxylate synthase